MDMANGCAVRRICAVDMSNLKTIPDDGSAGAWVAGFVEPKCKLVREGSPESPVPISFALSPDIQLLLL